MGQDLDCPPAGRGSDGVETLAVQPQAALPVREGEGHPPLLSSTMVLPWLRLTLLFLLPARPLPYSLLRLLNSRLGTLLLLGVGALVRGVPCAFVDLPRERREAVLLGWSQSPRKQVRGSAGLPGSVTVVVIHPCSLRLGAVPHGIQGAQECDHGRWVAGHYSGLKVAGKGADGLTTCRANVLTSKAPCWFALVGWSGASRPTVLA